MWWRCSHNRPPLNLSLAKSQTAASDQFKSSGGTHSNVRSLQIRSFASQRAEGRQRVAPFLKAIFARPKSREKTNDGRLICFDALKKSRMATFASWIWLGKYGNLAIAGGARTRALGLHAGGSVCRPLGRAGLAIVVWSHIARDQRALLLMPALAVPAIEDALVSERAGMAFVAGLLLAAEQAVSVNLSTDFRELVRTIGGS